MKSIKIVALFALLIGSMSAGKAQKEDWGTDSLECRKCLSLYNEPLRQKNYAEAVIHWRGVVRVCPKVKESVYINGAIIYRSLIDAEKDAAAKEKLIDTLAWVYDKRMEYFGRSSEALEAYGNDMIRYRQSNPSITYNLLKELVEREQGKSSCVALMRYYQSMVLMYRKKEAGIDNNKMVEEYFRTKELLEQSIANNPDDKNCAVANEEVDKYGMPFLPCEKIYEYAKTKHKDIPTEDKAKRLAEMKKLLEVMNKRSCNDNEIYDKILAEVLEAEPSADGYYSLGLSNNAKKKFSEANANFKKAIEVCGDCDKLGEYLMGAAKANLNSGNLSVAASYARQAMSKDSKMSGQANIVIAQAIARSGCGNNSFEQKFNYCLAVEYLNKAKALDPSVSEEANRLIGSCKANFPTKAELFERGLLGKDFFPVGCWINENAPIPKY